MDGINQRCHWGILAYQIKQLITKYLSAENAFVTGDFQTCHSMTVELITLTMTQLSSKCLRKPWQ